MSSGLRVIVDYDREPWILDAGTVRVTFDMGVRAAVGSWDIFDPTLPTPAGAGAGQAGAGSQVHRVSAPARAGFSSRPGRQELTAVSKYVLCCDKTAYQHGFTYWNEP